MSTYPRLPFRQSGPRPALIRGGVVGRLMRGMTAFGILLALGFALCENSVPIRAAAAPNSVVVIPVNGAIDPASADFIVRGLKHAADDHAQLAVLQLDTPGGLDTSMRQIIKAILGSPVPVATFIAPSGARAASAGTYIIYASHIAAMAPGTNLGAATPIQMGIGGAEPPAGGGGMPGLPGGGAGAGAGAQKNGPGAPASADSASSANPANSASAASSALPLDTQSTEMRKQVHDAAAYIRGLAQMRGRNADWAERAVREAVSLSASEALAQHVVDLNARDIPDLLRQVDGRTISTAHGDVKLSTANVPVITLEADWRNQFLAVITDPNVALVLLMIGMYGLFFEFANPGFVLPGVVGAISLLMGLFAMQMLPVNYVGLGLIFLGTAFLIGEAFLPTFGSLGFGGVVAFVIGSLMLIDTDVPGYGIPLPLIAAVVVFSVVFVFGVSRLALRARRRPVVTGSEGLIGSLGVVLDGGLLPDGGLLQGDATADAAAGGTLAGWAQVCGERWRVSSTAPVAAGHAVRVTARRGLTLTVVPAEALQQGERS
ncbi:nodulation protein NfeD [Paraburkholderia sp. 1N]|uniref:Nodulation protein NfeD n=1 Tax=Paraburkholderia solitsugae TaxID=2675748 RepID=A0ABX2C4P2_9BURK|nr:nodulation protein NfeD [Paraburkholderia solitsugae]NPT47924.1 nodulation protein NfeD [Paraburkholderia solitsugae]